MLSSVTERDLPRKLVETGGSMEAHSGMRNLALVKVAQLAPLPLDLVLAKQLVSLKAHW